MTYQQALDMGYRNGDVKWTRGYTSRRCDINRLEVGTAGGTRKGQRYVVLPTLHSTVYSLRQYLVAPEYK